MSHSIPLTRIPVLLIPLLAAGLLLYSTVQAATQVSDQETNTVYLPLVSLAPPDVYGQFLNSIGGKDNLFYIAGPLAFLGRGHQLVILDVARRQIRYTSAKCSCPPRQHS